MKLFYKSKDGGNESTVTGYWLIESKKLFSIGLLKFEGKSREAFHNHAFNALSWIVRGTLKESILPYGFEMYFAGLLPIFTSRKRMHKVDSIGTTWVLTFRGPWNDQWKELRPTGMMTLTHGRKEI